ncbi:MAG: LysE family translocator [Gammaproteobacteria bacterium]|nr:LysE family translocator [Gammaproteobacteria bacterium]
MEIHNWLLFASIAFIAAMTPGPAILLATSHSMAYGWRFAVFTALGNISGLFLMSALSVAGLSAIILNSILIFTVVKLIGAAYLIYLGIRIWRKGFIQVSTDQDRAVMPKHRGKLYLQGLTVALSNPKAIAFTTALFPQFVSHERDLFTQFGLLVATTMFLSFVCLIAYAYLAERTKARLFSGAPVYLNKLLGAGFIAAGFGLASATRGAV